MLKMNTFNLNINGKHIATVDLDQLRPRFPHEVTLLEKASERVANALESGKTAEAEAATLELKERMTTLARLLGYAIS